MMAPKKHPVTVMLASEDYETLAVICSKRGQSRADFLRGAITVPEAIPVLKTRPLVGACLQKHQDRLKREQSERRARKRRD